jgi:hypothetical protein
LLLFHDLGKLLNLLLKRFLVLGLLDCLSSLDLFVDLLGNLRSDGDLSVLGLLLNSFGLDLKSLDGVLKVGDLGADGNFLLLILLELGSLSLDASLDSLNFSFKVSDLILNLGNIFLLLGGGLLALELCDSLGVLGHSVLVGLDVSLFFDNSISNETLLSGVLTGLLSNSVLSLVGGMLVSNSILSNSDSLMSMLVSMVSSADSVNTSSLNLLVSLEGVVRSSLDGSVGSVVGSP